MAVSYIAKLEDGTVFERKGIDGEHPLVFVIDEGQLTILDLFMSFVLCWFGNPEENLTAVLTYFAECCL